MSKVSVDQFAKEIEKTLEDFIDVTEEAAGAGVLETAKEVVSELHAVSPPNGAPKYKSWGAYLRGWARKNLKKGRRGEYVEVVYNRTHYQLAHLLEHGHALWQGGRADAFPHIAPIAEKAENMLLENIKKRIDK